MNKAIIIGNITADPELKTTTGGTSVTSFSVATNKKWTTESGEKKESVEYHNCVAWTRLAEIIAEFGHKGLKVMCEGELQTRSWEDDAGKKHYRTEIRVSNFEMLSAKQKDAQAAPAANTSTPPVDNNFGAEDLPF